MAASLLRLSRSLALQNLRETLALRGTVVSANLTTKSTKPTNTKKKKHGGIGVASEDRVSTGSQPVPAPLSPASNTSPTAPALPHTKAGLSGNTRQKLPQPVPAPRATKNMLGTHAGRDGDVSMIPRPASHAAGPRAKADETTSSSDSSSESDSEEARGATVKPRGLAKPQQFRRDSGSVAELPRRQQAGAGLAGGPGEAGGIAAPGQRNVQLKATLSQGGKGGEASVREELVNPTESRREQATAWPPTQSATTPVPPTALPIPAMPTAMPTPMAPAATPTPVAPKATPIAVAPTPALHTAPPTPEAEQKGMAEEPPEQEMVSEAQPQATKKVLECVPAAASAETQENQAEPEAAPEPAQEELDLSTYKNTQHHHYTTMTFVDLEGVMSKYRLPQPSSGRLTPRH